MIRLKVLSGKKAGATFVARRFPVRIGRAPDCAFRLEEDGVWDRHLLFEFSPAEGVILTVQPGALASLGSQPIQRAVLRNGDLIEIGSLKLQFWLSETRQVRLEVREWLTWLAIAAVTLGQIVVIYWLSNESK